MCGAQCVARVLSVAYCMLIMCQAPREGRRMHHLVKGESEPEYMCTKNK